MLQRSGNVDQLTDHFKASSAVGRSRTACGLLRDDSAGLARSSQKSIGGGSPSRSPDRTQQDFVIVRRAKNTSTSALAEMAKPRKLRTLKSFMREHGISQKMAPDVRERGKRANAKKRQQAIN